jgi:hypothetical protein
MPDRAPARENCAVRSGVFSTVEKPLLDWAKIVVTAAAPVTIDPFARVAAYVPGRIDARPFSPPDLCLLNSVLTI